MDYSSFMNRMNDLLDEIRDPDGTGEETELDEYDQGKIDGINAAKDAVEEARNA